MDRFNRFGVLIAFLVFFILLACFNSYSTDDAFITYRYAQNMADGHGLIFNPGQAPVEGYTNFLWAVILAAGAKVLLPLPETATFLSVLSGLGLLILLGIWAYRQNEFTDNFKPMIPVLLLASYPAMALWSSTGMETLFFSFLLVLGSIFLSIEERNEWIGILSGIAFALAGLTRPEGIVIGLCLVVFSFLESRDWGTRFIAFCIRLIIFLLPVSLHVLWRRSFYGYWLPNTFYAKTATGTELVDNGLLYLKGFMLSGGAFLFLLVVLAVFIRPKIDGLWTIILTTLVYSGMVVWAGGDWMPGYRLLIPIIPFLVMGASTFVSKSIDASPRFAMVLGALIAINFLYVGITSQAEYMRHSMLSQKVLGEEPQLDVLVELGRHLKEVSTGHELLAVIPAGKVPFYSGLQTLDMRGLCDRHIARQAVDPDLKHKLTGHLKRDPKYVLKEKPDYIVLTGAELKPGAEVTLTENPGKLPILDEWTITKLPEFKENYEKIVVPLPQGSKNLVYFKRVAVSS